MQGFLDFNVSFDFCTATMTLLFSSTSPSSVSLLPIPLALSYRMLNVLSLLVLSEYRVRVGGGEGDVGGDCWVGGTEQES